MFVNLAAGTNFTKINGTSIVKSIKEYVKIPILAKENCQYNGCTISDVVTTQLFKTKT